MENNYNKKSLWKWILICVIIAVVAYGVIYYFFFYKNGYSYNNQETSYNNQTNSNDQNSNSEIADWRTYRNDEYGFEVKYPKNWWIGEQINMVDFLGPSSGGSHFALRISIYPNPNKLSSKDFVLERLKEPERGSGFEEFTPREMEMFRNGKELWLEGLIAFQIEEDNYEHIYLARDSSVIEFYFINVEKNISGLENPNVVNAILSTFKFIR